MSNLDQAAKSIISLYKLIGPIIDAAPDLERIGALQDYEIKTKNNIEALKQDQKRISNEIKVSLQKANDDKAQVKLDVDNLTKNINDKKDELDNHILNKNKEAQNIIDLAKSQSNSIIDNAKKDALKIIDDAKENIKQYDVTIEQKKEILLSVNKDIETRSKALSDINTKLDRLRNV